MWRWRSPTSSRTRRRACDYRRLNATVQKSFAKRLLWQRLALDRALARGKRSPDGRFTAATINLGGAYNCEEIVIREGTRPERRYAAIYFTSDADLAWLDETTILHHLSQPSGDVEFYTLDARTGRRSLVAVVGYDAPHFVTDWGVSAPGTFWYLTDDGQRHEVTRPASRP